LRLVLDTNEFIGALDIVKNPFAEQLFNILLDTFPKNTIYIPRTIINEVKRNIHPRVFAEFIKALQPIATIDEDIIVPFELGIKYESKGLKPSDAFIAAYTEWVGADALITENRHFLSRQSNLPFKVLNAKGCLKLLKK
jgi:predicted nucleic acid-binding protein